MTHAQEKGSAVIASYITEKKDNYQDVFSLKKLKEPLTDPLNILPGLLI